MSKSRSWLCIFLIATAFLKGIVPSAAESKCENGPSQTAGVRCERLPDGVERWSLHSKDQDDLPFFFRIFEKTADVIVGREELPFRRTVAFLVGVSAYPHLKPNLPFVDHDLDDIRRYLLIENGVDEVYVASGKVATASLVNNYMANKFRSRLDEEDRLIFYFAGHGTDGGGTTGYMQLFSAESGDLATDVVMVSSVREWSRLIPAKHILFLFDSCSSGLGVTPRATQGDTRKKIINTLTRGGSRIVITAGFADQKTFEIPSAHDRKRGNGVFTKALLDALRSGAGEGYLTVNEVFATVEKRVAEYAASMDENLTPRLWILDESSYPGTFIFLNQDIDKLKTSVSQFRPYFNAQPRRPSTAEFSDQIELARAQSLRDQGILALRRGNLPKASSSFGAASDIRSRLVPGGLLQSESLRDLGLVALEEASFDRAQSFFESALAIAQRQAPNGQHEAACLTSLGQVSLATGDLEYAERFFLSSLKLLGGMGRKSLLAAENLRGLGRVSLNQGDLEAAQRYFEEAEGLLEDLAPSNWIRSNIHRDRSHTFSMLGDSSGAIREAVEAVDAFELQFFHAGGTRFERALFRQKHWHFNAFYVGLLGESNESSQAFMKLDHLRGRVLLEALHEDVDEIPPKVLRPWASLDSGTAVLAFNVRDDDTQVFVRDIFGNVTLAVVPLGYSKLETQISRYARRIRPGRVNDQQQRLQGRWIYEQLITPVEDRLESAVRIAIVPDGPLYLLPFASLVRSDETDSEREVQYFAEWKPHFKISSLSMLHRIRSEPEAVSDLDYLLVADPTFPSATDVSVRGAANDAVVRAPFLWDPIPGSRREAEGIAALFGSSDGVIALGSEATKERFMDLAPMARWIHIATHSSPEGQNPLGAFLVFSFEDKEVSSHYLLSAEEIVQNLSLDAELVTLSGCETSGGLIIRHEGVMGLTWAFLAAGAESVLSALDIVDDLSTATFMIDFYESLVDGQDKASALRRAQLKALRDVTRSNPYYWSNFEIYGEWR